MINCYIRSSRNNIMNNILIKDETAAGQILQEVIIGIERDVIKVKDLIKLRVDEEVERYNKKLDGVFKGLIQPAKSEKILNGFRVKKGKTIDAEKQYYIALKAFTTNGFFIIVSDNQVSDLEEEIMVDREIDVSFIKLTPLVGG